MTWTCNTLRALEEALRHFAGCAVAVSHDRRFQDRLATHIVAFEAEEHVHGGDGNYQPYLQQRQERLGEQSEAPRHGRYKRLVRQPARRTP